MSSTQHAEAEPTGRREANKRDKLLRIRRATKDVFLEKGYEDATLREIAVAAGVAFGTLFLYAKNKKDLLLLVFDEELPRVTDRAITIAARKHSLINQVMAFFGEALISSSRRHQPFRATCCASSHSPAVSSHPACRKRWTSSRNIWRSSSLGPQEDGHVTSEIAPALAAHIFFSLHRVEIRACLDSPKPDIARSMAKLRQQLELVFAGLAPER